MLLKVVGTPMALPLPGTNYFDGCCIRFTLTAVFGSIMKNNSINGNPITLDGIVYTNGIRTHAIGGNRYNLGSICSRFHAVVGVDDEVGANGSVIFQVIADGPKDLRQRHYDRRLAGEDD